MYKTGWNMIRRVLRLTPLKYASDVWTTELVWNKWRIFSLPSHLTRRSVEQVRHYNQHDQLGKAIQSSTKAIKSTDQSDQAVETPFYTHLQSCLSPTDVLDRMQQLSYLQHHASSCLMRMWDTTKRMRYEQRRYELQLMFEHPAFESVCDRVTADAWRMKNINLSYSLMAIVKLGVLQNTRVVQTLLRVIQERLNQFDDRALSVLATCIWDMEESQNVQALQEALRLLLKDHTLEIQNVVVLQSMMRGVGKDSPVHLKKKLAMQALSLTDEFSPPNTQYMFSTLAAIGLSYKPLLDACSKKITENVHEFPFNRLLSVLKSCRELHYRDFTMFNAVSEYVANSFDMWSNKQVILFLISFEDISFRPVALLDAFAERIIQKSEIFTLKDVLGALKVFSLLNHDLKEKRLQFLDSVTRTLESYLPKMSPVELLKATYYLGLMEHFPQAPLEKLFQQDVLDQLLLRGRESIRVQKMLQCLDLCLRLDGPHLQTFILDLDSKIPDHEHSVNPDVISSVKNILGKGSVVDSVLEQGIYFIDGVITLSHKLDDESLSEQSVSPEGVSRIAVVCAPPSLFCFGTKRPRGILDVKLRHLVKLGYKPVLVPLQELNAQTEDEKKKILQELLFSADECFGEQASL